MGKIQLLDEATINQIAAGEVIESPPSVMKELVENSVDAGARHIRIEVRAGGFALLRIVDDGCGMSREDLELCLVRHATSKIRAFQDLEQVATLGFRGEALASIAAVSRLRIATCSDQTKEAYELTTQAGALPQIQPTSRSKGTTVEIQDLFYNVPARKAFQKSAAASNAELSRWAGYLALAYPWVSFTFISNDKAIELSRGQSTHWNIELGRATCAAVLGESFAERAYVVEQERSGWLLKGFLGNPLDHRPTRSHQIWIINNRVCQAPQLARAVAEGFGNRLPSGRFAQFVLYLTLPGNWVDVNVHPQKRELRFKDSGMIASWLAHGVNLALTRPRVVSTSAASESASLLKDWPKNQPSELDKESDSLADSGVESAEYSLDDSRSRLNLVNHASSQTSGLPAAGASALVAKVTQGNLPWDHQPVSQSKDRGGDHRYGALGAADFSHSIRIDSNKAIKPEIEGQKNREGSAFGKGNWPSSAAKERDFSLAASQRSFDLHLQPLVQWKRWSLWRVEDIAFRLEGWHQAMGNTDKSAQLVWMQGPRALARIHFERAMQAAPSVVSQSLLLPLSTQLPLGEMDRLEQVWDELHACGFELARLDRLTLSIQAIPVGLKEDEVVTFFHQLIESVDQIGHGIRERIALGIAKQIEHHVGQVGVAPSELILGLVSCGKKFFSPTGRAIFRPLQEEDFEVKGRSS